MKGKKMDITFVADQIKDRIVALARGRELLSGASMKRAQTYAEYDKELGLTLLKLKNNKIDSYEGISCLDLPVSIIDKVAKSICWEKRLEMDKAEAEYKVVLCKLNTIQSELNGFQSINRHLSTMVD